MLSCRRDADVCAPEGFPVDVVEDESGHFQVFFDRNGDVASTVVHLTGREYVTVTVFDRRERRQEPLG